MTFDKIMEDGRLWAVRYDGASDNILSVLFDRWNDVLWLRRFLYYNRRSYQTDEHHAGATTYSN